MYTIIIRYTTDERPSYLIVKMSDIGNYVVAETWSLNDAKVISNALSAADKVPAPF